MLLAPLMLGVNPFDQPGVEAYKKKLIWNHGKTELRRNWCFFESSYVTPTKPLLRGFLTYRNEYKIRPAEFLLRLTCRYDKPTESLPQGRHTFMRSVVGF